MRHIRLQRIRFYKQGDQMLTLVLGLLMMQEGYAERDYRPCLAENNWQLPESFIPTAATKRPLKPIIYFWRLVMGGKDSGKGDWHLYNKEDANWLKEASKNAQIEWTVMEGRLPL